ncbi:MAG: DNA polymerase IV, partial [Polaromonas sp.]
GQCLKRVPLEQRLRLLGVRAGALVKAGEVPIHEQKMPTAQSGRALPAIETVANDQLF